MEVDKHKHVDKAMEEVPPPTKKLYSCGAVNITSENTWLAPNT